ncbi:reverse transcriptase domain-containing protein [Tanacetum coccineum]
MLCSLAQRTSIKRKRPKESQYPLSSIGEKHKETEDLAADHSSRIENPHMEVLTEREITDEFSDEHLMVLKSKSSNDEPWLQQRKVFESGFIGIVVFKDANEYVRRCDACQRSGKTLSSRNGNVKLNISAVDYVSKWVEAQALPTNDARIVVKFLTQLFARAIKRILERLVGYNPKGWSEKLKMQCGHLGRPYKTPTGCTPFRLVYGKACHLPLNELTELRDGAYENTRIYKERTKKWHDSRLRGDKDFKVGDQVLLYNSRLKMYPGKLKSKWSGPNIVKTVYPHRAIEITDKDGFSFKVNGQRLKKYYGGNIDKEDDEVIEFENGIT